MSIADWIWTRIQGGRANLHTGCYPFQEGDAFVIKSCPHVYMAGNQPRFETDLIEGPNGQAVRLIAVPKFKETGEIVLLDAETLEPEVVKFEIFSGE